MNVIIKIEGKSQARSLGLLPRSRGVVHFFVHIKLPAARRPRRFTPRLLFLIDFPDTRGESSGVNVIFYAFFPTEETVAGGAITPRLVENILIIRH